MPVQRLSKDSLSKILSGDIREDSTCVVKFYSNGCHMCHSLSDYYHEISNDEKYGDLHFFAFNVDDYPEIEKVMKFNGVPTIFVIHSNIGARKPKLRLLADPPEPNDKTWYKVKDIRNFIDREAL